jgi:AraC family transcriptional regulator of adaptative response/methylated-DNA-[protein]-cysteine methyltransferase
MVTRAVKTDRIVAAFSADDARCEAVIRLDRATDGTFYYVVRITGVYCRPSWPARLALRGNV